MKRLLFLTMVTGLLAAGSQAVVLTQWDFNASNLTPSTGVGTASYQGGVLLFGFDSGSPLDLGAGNKAWNTKSYPAQSTNAGTAGVRFDVSSVGFVGLQVAWQQKNSNASSAWSQFQYSLNAGGSWTAAGDFQASNDSWNSRSVDLSSITAANGNAGFAFRVVSIFAPSTGAYAPTNDDTYSTAGTYRFDLVTVTAAPVPEPFTMALAAAGLGLAARRRMRRALGAP